MKWWLLFWTFCKIGLTGFGGGYSIVSLLMSEIGRLGLRMDQFANLLALDMVVPGPVATNAATYLGYLYGGVSGSIVATVGVSLPSYFLVLGLRRFLESNRNSTLVSGALSGAKSAAVGLIASAAFSIAAMEMLPDGMAALSNVGLGAVTWMAVLLFALSYAAAQSDKINPILLTLLGGAYGAIFLRG